MYYISFSSGCQDCLCSAKPLLKRDNNYHLKLTDHLCDTVAKPVREKYRRHGLIVLYLSQVSI